MDKLLTILLLSILIFGTASNGISGTASLANVISVKASGKPGAYQFSVEIESPDKGCQQFANWWEVLNSSGKLLYRRILFHSHTDEQPFVRSGGPVSISSSEVVWIRAHMHPQGYGGDIFKGTIAEGFKKAEPEIPFPLELEKQNPQPDGCAF
ncbi:MAG: hypothetical protein HQM13_11285 [SAR324 cluster bacterium]|nr:hypothetical protein [SAR324 cluster bacterium]